MSRWVPPSLSTCCDLLQVFFHHFFTGSESQTVSSPHLFCLWLFSRINSLIFSLTEIIKKAVFGFRAACWKSIGIFFFSIFSSAGGCVSSRHSDDLDAALFLNTSVGSLTDFRCNTLRCKQSPAPPCCWSVTFLLGTKTKQQILNLVAIEVIKVMETSCTKLYKLSGSLAVKVTARLKAKELYW